MANLIPRKNTSSSLRRQSEDSTNPFAFLRREMNELFEDFFNTASLSTFRDRGGDMDMWAPRINVSEDEQKLQVAAELPGMDEKSIDISVINNLLTIRGEKKEEKEEKKKNYYQREFSVGSFYRQIPLPDYVDTNQIQATYKKGLLQIDIPKSPEAKQMTKKVEVRAEH